MNPVPTPLTDIHHDDYATRAAQDILAHLEKRGTNDPDVTLHAIAAIIRLRTAEQPSPDGAYILTLTVGDWSNDGHGHSDTYRLRSSHSVSDVRRAYTQGCLLTGFALHDSGSDEHAGTPGRQIHARLTGSGHRFSAAGLRAFDEAFGTHLSAKLTDEDEYVSSRDVLEMFIRLARHARPDLTLETIDPEAPIIGFWNPELNISVGYAVWMDQD